MLNVIFLMGVIKINRLAAIAAPLPRKKISL